MFGIEDLKVPEPLETEHTEPEQVKKNKKKNKKNKGPKKVTTELLDEEPIKRIEIVRSQPVQFSKPGNKKQPAPQKPVDVKSAAHQ